MAPTAGRDLSGASVRHPPLRLVRYALPSLVSSVAALPLVLFVPAFYADDLGVPLAAVGVALAASRLLDVVTDPLIGIASDRLRLGWGRRKPWIVLGTPVFAVALWQLFVPGGTASTASLLGWSALLYLGFTMIDLPHKAWGAELSPDYDERSRITSWREGLSTAGQVALLAALVVWGARGVSDAASQLRGIALVVVIALPLLVAAAVLTVPEGRREGFVHERRSLFAGLRLVAANPAFRRMIGCVVFFVSGIAIQGTLHRLVLADVMRDEARFPLMLLVENLATLAAVPLWLRISLGTGKHRALTAAALWLAVFSVPLVFLREGDTTTLIALIAIRGSSFASILFLANSIAADVIDLDTLASGEQRSGLYFAVWGMTTKLSLALGVLLGTALPAAFGYDPAAEITAPAVQARLMAIYGGVPALLMAVGALFLRGFPVTRERHAAVRAELARRAAG
ncbi:MAG: MFS transporter [Myxococcota bacterium]|nr:MFS transporter [Myxococcota bacterium]